MTCNVLGTLEHLGSIENTFVMNEVKQSYSIHL